MHSRAPSFEAIKDLTLAMTTPEDAAEVHRFIEVLVADRLAEAHVQSQEVDRLHTYPHEHVFTLQGAQRIMPESKFGDLVFPIVKQDVIRYFHAQGHSVDYATNRWEHLVFPERKFDQGVRLNDSSMRGLGRGLAYISTDRNPHGQYGDHYPVNLLSYKHPPSLPHSRSVPEANILSPYVEPDTAVIDAVSLKTYLDWLDERPEIYDILLGQHFSEEDRKLWREFIGWVEKRTGVDFTPSRDHFPYYESVSDFWLWRETGRLAAVSFLDAQDAGTKPRKRITNDAWATILYPEPTEPYELGQGVWYIPHPAQREELTDEEPLITLADLRKALTDIGKSATSSTASECLGISSNALLQRSPFREFGDAARLGITLDPHFTGWARDKLHVSAGGVYELLLSRESPYRGTVMKKVVRRVLTIAGVLAPENLPRAEYDPAESAEINLDDPDLK